MYSDSQKTEPLSFRMPKYTKNVRRQSPVKRYIKQVKKQPMAQTLNKRRQKEGLKLTMQSTAESDTNVMNTVSKR
jgi:hypothetical protein